MVSHNKVASNRKRRKHHPPCGKNMHCHAVRISHHPLTHAGAALAHVAYFAVEAVDGTRLVISAGLGLLLFSLLEILAREME